ncbi:MAG: phosphate acetyltransferase [candidate division Zixibacteria bacterium RBG_16_50_21]|nr:MAG: phosphate acetyltransferase [candidate division Zixibacteria bacterium RBG_16_50_21]
MAYQKEALEYHKKDRPGKIEVVPTKPCLTQRDLSLAYTPGVAEPCLVIEKNPDAAYDYTARGNLVAVVSNGTAVLGLGNIGALAGKPVMEGKGVLFKRFADVDVFDIEIDSTDPDEIVNICARLEPTFGGINLEDIKAPECFYIEEKLQSLVSIPVFHDDQHGTAIITGAALLNAVEVTEKNLKDIKIVIIGAGASGIACARLFTKLGVGHQQIVMCDRKGVIYKGRREDMNPYKVEFENDTKARTATDALKGADMLLGLSGPNLVTPEMIKGMAKNPIIFACANPDPEISYPDAKAARPDAIIATGRSDYPNQVNNVLGFPFLFRGALDVRARVFNYEMKLAAVHALADLAKEDVPDAVAKVYGVESFHFGPDYLIPKPFDPRVLLWVAPAVAKAAMDSGVARLKIDIEEYKERLEARLGKSREVARTVINKARQSPKRIVFPEGTLPRILRAARHIAEEQIAHPILLGRTEEIRQKAEELDIELNGIEIIRPKEFPRLQEYARELYRLRQRKGLTKRDAQQSARDNNYFGTLMVQLGDADGLVSGVSQHYPDVIRPALQIIGLRPGLSRVCGVYCIIAKKKCYFFADATVNIQPQAEDLAEIAILTAEVARKFNLEPKVAMLSFSNFGSVKHPLVDMVKKATQIVRQRAPNLIIDGEMQVETAVDPEIAEELFPFSQIKGDANVLIFPDLQSGNIAYKLMQRLGGAESIGPILTGLAKPVHVLHQASDENDIINITAMAVMDAQIRDREKSQQVLKIQKELV